LFADVAMVGVEELLLKLGWLLQEMGEMREMGGSW
jgi:hypothetical protein